MSSVRSARVRRVIAAALGACALAATFSTGATASDVPSAYDGFAEAAALQVRVLKPAALPTSDELATIAIPFARAEASSSPLGRAIGSWLWPGETAADAKSLALVGLDPGADETACAERQAGTDKPRTLAIVANPAGGEIAVPDASDNPCGSASFKQIFAGQIDNDANSPTRGQRSGGVIRAMPDYPFWAVAQYPAPAGRTDEDRKVLCQAPGAVPDEPWHTPRDACPAGGMPDAGLSSAFASAKRDAAQASVADVSLGIVAARAVAATSSVEWKGAVLVATTSVQIDELRFAGSDPAVPLLTIESLRSVATASSDGRITAGSLDIVGARVALPGVPPSMPCSAARPCAVAIGRDGVTLAETDVPAQGRDALDQALSALAIRIPSHPADLAGQTAAAGLDAGGPAVAIAPDRRRAHVSGLEIDLAHDNSLEGRTMVALRIGAATAGAVAAFAPGIGGDVDTGAGGGSVPEPGITPGVAPPPPHRHLDPGRPATPHAPDASRPVASSQLPPSRPIPPALALLVLVLIVCAAAAMVAFGIWESAP